MQANHADFYTLFFNNGVRLIPEHFAAVLIEDIALHNRECCLAQLQQRVVPAMIELMVAHGNGIEIHGVHDIDNRFALGQAADIRPGKIVPGIQKPRCLIVGFFLLHHRRDIGPAANITGTIRNPWDFIGFNVGMEIVGIDNSDILCRCP